MWLQRNYAYTKNITETSECAADFFRSTEDNAPDFYSIMANLVMNDNPPVRSHGTARPESLSHRLFCRPF